MAGNNINSNNNNENSNSFKTENLYKNSHQYIFLLRVSSLLNLEVVNLLVGL